MFFYNIRQIWFILHLILVLDLVHFLNYLIFGYFEINRFAFRWDKLKKVIENLLECCVLFFVFLKALYKKPNLCGDLFIEVKKQITALILVFRFGKISLRDKFFYLNGIRIALPNLRHHFLKNDRTKFQLDFKATANRLKSDFKHINILSELFAHN